MSVTYPERQSVRHPHSPWTDERTAELARLWTQGLSASVIADRFNVAGLTRNSVIGKANRLKLPQRISGFPGRPKKAADKPKLKPQPKPPPPPRPRKPLAPASIPPVMRALQLVELAPKHCHFPVGDPKHRGGFFFCGADTDGRNYCPFHQLMTVAREQRQRARPARQQWLIPEI